MDEKEVEKKEEQEKVEGKKEGLAEKNKKDPQKNIGEAVEEKHGMEIENQDRELKKIFFVLGATLFVLLFAFWFISSVRYFDHNNVDFKVVKEGNLIFYNTNFPIYSSITGKHIADYNIYLRKDPRTLEDIPSPEKIQIFRKIVMASEGDLDCDGDGVIAVANFVNLFENIGVEVTRNDNIINCNPDQEDYTYVDIRESDTTEITKTGLGCYELKVNNCEVLDVTEKFMVDALSELNI